MLVRHRLEQNAGHVSEARGPPASLPRHLAGHAVEKDTYSARRPSGSAPCGPERPRSGARTDVGLSGPGGPPSAVRNDEKGGEGDRARGRCRQGALTRGGSGPPVPGRLPAGPLLRHQHRCDQAGAPDPERSDRKSAAMLLATRIADSRTESCARCA